ncbi:hypothetical protein L950_0211695 [Sphingobacterium sp. IITKGP-BTPF85]|nr:hypothetical protein L950_0211695 [Sphingobacterium sp. IITKGP-BTPF85]
MEDINNVCILELYCILFTKKRKWYFMLLILNDLFFKILKPYLTLEEIEKKIKITRNKNDAVAKYSHGVSFG